MTGRRAAWLQWIAAIWLTVQMAGGVASFVPAATDCGCGLTSCPMHHSHGLPADGARCHLIDPHQPSAIAVAFLLGPVAPAGPSWTLPQTDLAGQAARQPAFLSLGSPFSPPTPPPRS